MGGYLWRPVAPQEWDRLLRATGLVGIAAILVVEFAPSAPIRDFAVFFSLALFLNGPLTPLTPIGFEPVLMAFGQLYPPIVVAAVGVAAQMLVEVMNYHLYNAALRSALMTKIRTSRLVRWTIEQFGVQPFATIVFCALTPMPFWIVRIAAPLANYPIGRYLAAIALGRLPRYWFYATLGMMVPISGALILKVGLGVTVLVAGVIVWRQLASRSPTTSGPMGAVTGDTPPAA